MDTMVDENDDGLVVDQDESKLHLVKKYWMVHYHPNDYSYRFSSCHHGGNFRCVRSVKNPFLDLVVVADVVLYVVKKYS